MNKATGGKLGRQRLEPFQRIGHVVDDADAVNPLKLPLDLIDVVDAELAKAHVGGPRSAAAFGGRCDRLLTQINAQHLSLWIQVADIFSADSGAAACIQHPHGPTLGQGSGTKTVDCGPVPAPVIARWGLIEKGLWGKRIGVVEAGHRIADRLGFHRVIHG